MGPVFTFDMGVVIFLVGPCACELDGFFAFEEVVEEESVEELSAVIEIDTEDNEGQGIFHIFNLSGDLAESLAVGGSLFGPTGGDVDGIGGEGVGAFEGGTAVGDGVCFQESGSKFVPLPCFNGDVMLEKEPWFSGASAFASVEMFDGLEKSIDGWRRDL